MLETRYSGVFESLHHVFGLFRVLDEVVLVGEFQVFQEVPDDLRDAPEVPVGEDELVVLHFLLS